MSKTILIGMNNKFTAKANKWLFSLTGLLFLVNGIFNLYNSILEPIGLILGVSMIVGGIFYLFYGLFGFLENSKFSPKVQLDELTIELKNSLWKPSVKLKWSDLSSIKFEPYEVIFNINDVSNSFSFNANANVSVEIKQTIREMAERRNIDVVGG